MQPKKLPAQVHPEIGQMHEQSQPGPHCSTPGGVIESLPTASQIEALEAPLKRQLAISVCSVSVAWVIRS